MQNQLADGNGDNEQSLSVQKKTWHRLASRQHVVSLDFLLRAETGNGLKQFIPATRLHQLLQSEKLRLENTGQQKKRKKMDLPQQAPRPARPPLLKQPALVHTEDSYSVNVTAMTWLGFVSGAVYLWLPDPWHAAHNAALNAAKDCHLYTAVHLTSTAMDMAHGPWNTQKWFRMIAAALSEWLEHTDSDTDALLNELAPIIAAERGWDVHDTTDCAARVRDLVKSGDVNFVHKIFGCGLFRCCAGV